MTPSDEILEVFLRTQADSLRGLANCCRAHFDDSDWTNVQQEAVRAAILKMESAAATCDRAAMNLKGEPTDA